jgi:hypothetical protein
MSRIICMSWNEGYSGVIVVNIYPYVTGKVEDFWNTRNRLLNDGGDVERRTTNLKYVREAGERADLRIVAFGGIPSRQGRDQSVREDIQTAHAVFGCDAKHLGMTKGWPLHPGSGGRLRRFADAERWVMPQV